MAIELPLWAELLYEFGPWAVAIFLFFRKQDRTSNEERSTIHTLKDTVEKNTALLDSHTITLTTHTALLENLKERAAEDRARRP